MNYEEKKALDGSIRKWERIVDGSGTDSSGADCPLCKLHEECHDCVAMDMCYATYQEWLKHHYKVHRKYPRAIICNDCRELAIRILTELKSLRD